ncbi:MAG: DUF4331 domain-containing protein [Thermomicrobiales bacterium]
MRTRSFAGLALLLAALIAGSSFFNLNATPSRASSHREAPQISTDPTADNTDLYAFVSPDRPETVTIISAVYPGQDPAGGPNFYRFGDDVLYDIKIDNDGDAVEDITYRFDFESQIQTPNTFLYNTGPIESLDDADWNIRQGYSITRITDAGEETLPFEGVAPPVNIGPKSTPNYESLARQAIGEIDGMRVFAGQRDDPFWVDLGGVFDLLTIRQLPGNAGGGIDDLKGLNVLAIAIQVPIADLTSTGAVPDGAETADAVIGVWSTTNRFSTTVINADGSRTTVGDLVQVSRLGMPLVNEVVVPLGAKDRFNASQPKDDAQFLAGVTDPELPKLLNLLYGIEVPTGEREDLVQVFLTGVPGLNQPANVVPSEMLRLNVAIPPAAQENPLGVIGGDLAGFPNGRRLGDEVVDVALRVVAGVLVGDEFNVSPNNALGDGIDANDKPFGDEFPYVVRPHGGFEHQHHRAKGAQPASPDASPAAETSAEGITVELAELNGSGVSGTATLTDGDEGTSVVIQATGATGNHPAHIHEGTCDDLDPNPAFPLTDIDASGSSTSVVPVALADLTGGDFAINVHLSQEQIGVYVMCGAIGG